MKINELEISVKSMNRYLILDTETTGLKPFDGDKIIEIGIVEVIDGKITNKTLQHYIQPDKKLTKEAIKIHKITDEMLEGKPRFSEISNEVINFICDDNYTNQIVAHNANFDMKFLHHEFNQEQNEKLKKINVIDTLVISRKKFPNEKVSLDNLCTKFGVSLEEREKQGHGALLDSMLLAKIFIEFMKYENFEELCNGVKIFFGFKKREEKLKKRDISKISEMEKSEHEKFLNEILKIENKW